MMIIIYIKFVKTIFLICYTKILNYLYNDEIFSNDFLL